MRRGVNYSVIALMLLVLVFISTLPALATGLQVRPGKIAVEMKPGESHNATLLVRNDQSDESHYKVYVKEKAYESWITLGAADFSLPSQQSRDIDIIFNPPLTASGEHKLYIRVLTVNPSSGVTIGAGIKVPIYITLSEKTVSEQDSISDESPVSWPLFWGIIAVLIAIVAVLLVYILILRRQRTV